MARVILKDPNKPSLKKTHTPLSVKYKRYLRLSIFLNILLCGGLVYVLNKPAADVLFVKLLNKIQRLM